MGPLHCLSKLAMSVSFRMLAEFGTRRLAPAPATAAVASRQTSGPAPPSPSPPSQTPPTGTTWPTSKRPGTGVTLPSDA